MRTITEEWKPIPEFPSYSISSQGRVFNHRFDREMRVNPNNHGHMKITLTDEETGERYDRSVAKLVAEAFLEPPNEMCDHIVILDGDFSNVTVQNLAWRPEGFAYRYTRQLKEPQPLHYQNLPVINLTTRNRFANIMSAGMEDGLLFSDIWRSTWEGSAVFPQGYIFEILE